MVPGQNSREFIPQLDKRHSLPCSRDAVCALEEGLGQGIHLGEPVLAAAIVGLLVEDAHRECTQDHLVAGAISTGVVGNSGCTVWNTITINIVVNVAIIITKSFSTACYTKSSILLLLLSPSLLSHHDHA